MILRVHEKLIFMVNVGKQIPYMDPMAISPNISERYLKWWNPKTYTSCITKAYVKENPSPKISLVNNGDKLSTGAGIL